MANIPPLKVLPSAFAQYTASAYKNIIDAIRGETTPPNAATYEDGFGEATFKPVTDGDNSGLPPRGGDVNGILNELSTPIYRAQMGLPINTWDASIAAQGYPKGAVVIYPDGDSTEKQQYISLVDNNTSNPTSSAWKKMYIDYIIDYGLSGTGDNIHWYRQYNSGWCEEGGTIRLNAAVGKRLDTTIPLLKIKNCVYANIIPSVKSAGDDNDFGISALGVSTGLNCWIHFNKPVGGLWQAYWEAKGYIS